MIQLPVLSIIGIMIIFSFYLGKSVKYIKLPSIIGYMLLGLILGPSFINLLTDSLQENLNFITDIALSFVALTIGLELKISSLKKLGKSIVLIILFESFAAFIAVFILIYLLTGDIVMSMLFASVAPASAPAGTVAIIQEYKAKGNLTNALYAVVGFDDGLGIIIFGFSLAIAKDIIGQESGANAAILTILLKPLLEIFFSFLIGTVGAFILAMLSKKLKNAGNIFILTFGFILLISGLCQKLHLSIILTNMIVGMVIINTQPRTLVMKMNERVSQLMPLIFILFFTMAGSNLHVKSLPSLGLIGIVYLLGRSGGLMGGAKLGAIIGKSEEKIRKYLGFGILSQAGVAIGLSLMIKQEFEGLGPIINKVTNFTEGDKVGAAIITTVTATSIFFEIIGPILTKYALKKAGEIK